MALLGRAMQSGEKIRLMIQTEDGTVMELPGYVVECEISTDYMPTFDSESKWLISPLVRKKLPEISATFTVRGAGPLTRYMENEWAAELDRRSVVREWKCDYCGCVHPIESYRCTTGCGAPRPFTIG